MSLKNNNSSTVEKVQQEEKSFKPFQGVS